MTKTQPTPVAPPAPMERGRGALILVLGILSIVMFGFITGIPAWVMGHTDLRRMREGKVEPSDEGLARAGMILGIIGTVISALALLLIVLIVVGLFSFAGLMIFQAEDINAQERAIESHLYVLARDAATYRLDKNTYEGYEIPSDLRRTDHESFTAQVSADEIRFRGRATNRKGSIEATLDRDGELVDWIYRGAFSEEDEKRHERILHRILRLVSAP